MVKLSLVIARLAEVAPTWRLARAAAISVSAVVNLSPSWMALTLLSVWASPCHIHSNGQCLRDVMPMPGRRLSFGILQPVLPSGRVILVTKWKIGRAHV